MFNITSVPLNYVNSNLYRLIDSYIIKWLEDYSVNQSFDWDREIRYEFHNLKG